MLILEVHPIPSAFILLFRSEPWNPVHTQGAGIVQGCEYQEARITGDHHCDVYHTTLWWFSLGSFLELYEKWINHKGYLSLALSRVLVTSSNED